MCKGDKVKAEIMGRVLTLLYHRVREYTQDTQLLAVSPENFKNQIQYLKKNYKIVRFEEDWSKFDDDAICITFDDGYRDNFLNAVPILNELDVPATIFVSTGNIDTKKEMWWDELERNLLVNKDYNIEFVLKDSFWNCTWDTTTKDRREDLYYTLHWLMKNCINVERRENWISQLQSWNNYDGEGRIENLSLQTQDLREIDLKNITIGAHTVNHPALSKLGYDEQHSEIKGSKLLLERIFDKNIDTFSYPFGGLNDFNEQTIQICSELGFTKAAANIPGVWTDAENEFQIPRNIVRDWCIEDFREKISTLLNGAQG